MQVGSTLELYTTLHGWSFFNSGWSLLTITGLAFIPFAVMIVSSFVRSFTGMEANSSAAASVRDLWVRVIAAFVVIVFAAQPAVPLGAGNLSFNPRANLANAAPPPESPGDTHTLFDATSVAATATTAHVPLYWYAVMATTSGINAAMLAAIPDASSHRQVEQLVGTIKVTDPQLREQLAAFEARCYRRARNLYSLRAPQTAASQRLLQEHGDQDVDWIGSRTFLELPGYYDAIDAGAPVPNWPTTPAAARSPRERLYVEQMGTPPPAGIPTCADWWADPTRGLRTQLAQYNQNPGFLLNARSWIANKTGGDTASIDDAIARAALTNTGIARAPTPNAGQAENASLAGRIGGGLGDMAGLAGGALIWAPLRAGLHATVSALPAIQAALLMVIYAGLPFAIVLSGYSFRVLLYAGVGIAVVRFWTVLWALAAWFDGAILDTVYGSTWSTMAGLIRATTTAGTSGASIAAERLIIDIVQASMYLGFPMIFSAVIGWAGVSGIEQLAIRAGSSTAAATQAGSRGATAAAGLKNTLR